jgi:hypothetical protein
MRKFIHAFFILINTCAIAQVVTDNFADGDFTTNPSWTGDNTEYTVNSSFQLQLNNTVAGASYLSTSSPQSSLNNMEWRFYIKQTFAPSSSNYGRVYLASDQPNLESSLNGYYLQFGEAGSIDAVELFRQTGTTSTSVARAADGQIASSFTVGIKVTRNAAGLWSLSVDPTGGSAYVFQDSGTDNTYTTASYFGVATVYTSSNANKFYFDDFYYGPLVVDVTPPSIASVTATANNTVDVLFSENVALTSSQLASNYSVNNGIGAPSSAVRDISNLSLVHLTFSNSFTNGMANVLTVSNVQDLNANTLTNGAANFTYSIVTTAAFKDIIINELFADPSPQIGLPASEFVELYNKSSSSFNLGGWKLSDASSSATLPNYILVANQHLIICSNADTALYSPFGNTLGVSSLPSLNNSGDRLYLQNNVLQYIDSVNYTDDWYQDAVKKGGGYTLELINPLANSSCPESGNWIASNNTTGGTPGTQNSVYSIAVDTQAPSILSVTVVDSIHINVCFSEALSSSVLSVLSNYSINNGIGVPVADTINSSLTCVYLTLTNSLATGVTYTLSTSNITDCAGNPLTASTITFSVYGAQPFDIVINEIMADPEPVVSSLPAYEYLELYNKTQYAINLENWTLTIGTTVKVLPSIVIAADSFLVITSATAQPLFDVSIATLGLSSLSLPNTGQTLVLANPSGAIISTVSYTDDWYQNSNKVSGGWSIEQIDPTNPCGGISNWAASSNSIGGTPGIQNSVWAANPDLIAPKALRATVVANDTVRVYFNEPIDSTTMLALTTYSIDNGIGNPISVDAVGPDYKSIILALSTSLQVGAIYTLTINNMLSDCAGNPIGGDNTVRFAIPETASISDVVINELLADPKTGGVDFVEIYNRSNKVVDLKTMTLSQYDTLNNVLLSIEEIAPDGYLLFPNDYLVLSEGGEIVKTHYTTTNTNAFLDMQNLPSLSISSGTVCLATSAEILDLFIYDEKMHYALLNDTKGVSLERIDFERPTKDRTNWHSAAASVGYATPGYKNSQYNDAGEADDVIEITPEVFSPDEDGMNDVVNINYKFNAPGFVANVKIYDSKGRMIKDLVRSELLGTTGTFSWDGITDTREKARMGIYIIFFEAFDLSGTVKQYKKTCVLGGKL